MDKSIASSSARVGKTVSSFFIFFTASFPAALRVMNDAVWSFWNFLLNVAFTVHKFGTKRRNMLRRSSKDLSSVWLELSFSSSTAAPVALHISCLLGSIVMLSYLIFSAKKRDFSRFILTPAPRSRVNTYCKCVIWLSNLFENTTTSSRCIYSEFHCTDDRMTLTTRRNIASAFFRKRRICTNRKSPSWLRNIAFNQFCSAISIYQYPKKSSYVECFWAFLKKSIHFSIFDRW